MDGFLRETEFLNNSLEAWITAFFAAIAAYSALTLFRRYGLKRLAAVTSLTRNRFDDLIMIVLADTKTFFIFLLALLAGMSFLEAPVLKEKHQEFLLVVLVAAQIGIWGNVVITHLLSRSTRDFMNNNDPARATTMIAVGYLGRIALWALIILLVLDNLGVDVTTLIAGLGIGGVAVALAVQNVLGDLLASLSIVLDKPFVIGDVIQVGADVGSVEKIGLKTTRLKSISGEQLIYSNSDLLKAQIRNYKRMHERRVPFILGVTYDVPAEKLKRIPEIVRGAVENTPRTRFDRCHLSQFGASSLDFEAVYFVLDADFNVFREVHQTISLAILEGFRREGIEFAFPTRTLHVVQDSKNERV